MNRLTNRPCLAERVLALSDICFVCGGAVYERVGPSPGDIPGIYADLACLVADLLDVDPSPEATALAAALGVATEAYQRTVPLFEAPSR